MKFLRPISTMVLVLGIAGANIRAVAQIPNVATTKDGVPTLAPLLRRITPAVPVRMAKAVMDHCCFVVRFGAAGWAYRYRT